MIVKLACQVIEGHYGSLFSSLIMECMFFDFEFQLLEVEKDPVKLTTYLCGSNYKLEGEDVQLKPDSEYPDWLFTMDIKRPKPKSWEIEDKQSLEYFRATALEAKVKWKRLHQKGLRGLRDRK